MAHRLRTVDLDFLESAPHRFVFEAEVPASRTAVFGAISADPSTWTWWPGHDEGRYESPEPHGVGSRRHMRMGDSWYRETILAWEEPSRWAYRVDESADALLNALVEEWVVEGDDDRSTVRWTFAVDPGPDFEAGIAGVEKMIGDMFDEAMANLGARWRAREAERMAATVSGYSHVAISVTDLDEARDFYCDVLGFEVLPRPDFGFPGLWLRVGALQLHLGVVDEAPAAGPGFPHFALHVPAAEFDATIEAVRAAGVKVLGAPSSRVDFGTTVRAAFVTDPSGNVIELTDVGPLTRT